MTSEEAKACMARNYPRSNLHNAYDCIESLSGRRVFNVIGHNPYVHGAGDSWEAALFNAAANYPPHTAAEMTERAEVSDADRARQIDSEDRAAAVRALSGKYDEFDFMWLMPRVLYRGHQHWKGGLASEQFIGVNDKAFHDMLAEAFVCVRAEAYAAGVAAEREACAKVCESLSWKRDVDWWLNATKKAVSEQSAHECAAIRARAGAPSPQVEGNAQLGGTGASGGGV